MTGFQHPHYPLLAGAVDPKTEARERFRNVIRLAGYTNPEPILEEWFEQYWNGNREEFFAMMTEYEEKYKEDGEII